MINDPKNPVYESQKMKHGFEITESFGNITLTIRHNNIIDEIASTVWKSDWHAHSLCEIAVLISGDAHIIFDNQTDAVMSSHDICIIPERLSHACYPLGEKQKRISLLISVTEKKENSKKVFGADHVLHHILTKQINNNPNPILLKNNQLLYGEINAIIDTLQSKDPLTSAIFKYQIILFVFHCFSTVYQQSQDYMPINGFDLSFYNTDSIGIRNQQIEKYFYDHYRSCTIQELADYLHLGVRQTNRVIQKHFGMGFKEVVHQYRMIVAQKMLLEGKDIALIAEHIGYRSISGFRKAFKAITNCTPTEFTEKYVIQKQPLPKYAHYFNLTSPIPTRAVRFDTDNTQPKEETEE